MSSCQRITQSTTSQGRNLDPALSSRRPLPAWSVFPSLVSIPSVHGAVDIHTGDRKIMAHVSVHRARTPSKFSAVVRFLVNMLICTKGNIACETPGKFQASAVFDSRQKASLQHTSARVASDKKTKLCSSLHKPAVAEACR